MKTEETKSEYMRTSQHWQAQHLETQKALKDNVAQLVALEMEKRLLSHELSESRKHLKMSQDQAKLLAMEKWDLAQEKAQLVGQLKQMQLLAS